MFGYIKVDKDELKIKDYKKFQMFYCGICNMLRKRYGLFFSSFLNYEVIFLYIFLTGITPTNDLKPMKLKCPLNPLFSKQFFYSNSVLDFTAFINIFLVLLKCKDDIADQKSIYKKFLKRYIESNSIFSADLKKYKNLVAYGNDCYDALLKQEKNYSSTIDECTEPMGNILKYIVADYIERNLKAEISQEEKRKIENLSMHLGRWVYLADAYDDYKCDIKNQEFNPILHIRGQEKKIKVAKEMLLLSNYIMNVQIHNIKIYMNKDLVYNYFEYGLRKVLYKIDKTNKYDFDKMGEI